MLDTKMISSILMEQCKDAQKKGMLDTLQVSSNQPDLKAITDVDALINVLNSLPEELKYNALFDDALDANNKELLKANKPALDGLNTITRNTQLSLVKSLKDVKIVGVLEVLIQQMPKLILQNFLLNVSQVLAVGEDPVICKLTVDEVVRV